MSNFCKLFNTQHGQILVMMDTDDEDAPCIKFIFKGAANIGLCTTTISLPDDDVGYEARQQALDEMTEERAIHYTAQARDFAKEFEWNE